MSDDRRTQGAVDSSAQAEMAGGPAQLPFVSVIIPVLNDAERLGRCLHGLEGQTYPEDRYEVIVVDNGSTDNVRRVVDRCPHARYHSEPRPGSYAARNRGLEVARGEVLAFTDADCLPARDWLSAGVTRVWRTHECGLVAGRVEVICRDPGRPTTVELFDQVFGFPQQRFVEQGHFGATANLLTRRFILQEVGPFDARLISGGDFEWCRRAVQAGYGVCYADEVRVAHPARSTLKELNAKAVRVAVGLDRLNAEDPARWAKEIVKSFLPRRDQVRVLIRDPRLGGPPQRVKVLLVLLEHRWVRAAAGIWVRLSREAQAVFRRGIVA